MFLKYLGKVTALALKNNLRINLDSKPEKVKNIEARKEVWFSHKNIAFLL